MSGQMRRLFIPLLLAALPGVALAVTRVSQAGPCNPGPCLWSSGASWSGGVVPIAGVDSFAILTSHSMTLDTDADVATADCADTNTMQNDAVLISDGLNRTLTIRPHPTTACTNLAMSGDLTLKAGDKMVCVGNSTINECLVGFPASGTSFKFLNDGTIGAVQRASQVGNVATVWTVSGISTAGFAVGDIIAWENGRAESSMYEITTLTATSLTYNTALLDSASLDLHLTADEGTLGGAPTSLHSLPDVTPATNDAFTLVKPVKWTYSGASGGYWGLRVGNARFDAASDVRLRGFSIINAARIPVSNGLRVMEMKFSTSHTGIREFRYMNLGEHQATQPYVFQGQGMSFDQVYCHDSISGSGTAGGCWLTTECTVAACGVAYAIQDLYIGRFHGTRTSSMPLSIGAAGTVNDPQNVVVWKPTFHDVGNASAIEAAGMQMLECTNCLVYGGRCWNVHDPDGSGGFCYGISSPDNTTKIVDSYAINTGVGILLTGGEAVNVYVSNTRDGGIDMQPIAPGSGTVYSSVVNKWGLDTTATAAILNLDADGVVLLGGTTQVTAYAWLNDAARSTAIVLRNIIAKGYKGDEAIKLAATLDQNVTGQHITFGGPSTGAGGGIDAGAVTAAVTLTFDDIAANDCGTAAALVCAGVGPTDNAGKVARDTDVCAAPSGTCSAGPTNVTATDLKFVAPGSSNYNVTDPTSVLWRAGLQPANSFLGVRCVSFDPSRLFPGLTIDASWSDVQTEPCHDGDRDGYLTIVEGTNTIDSCAVVTDLRNAATCANGETPPGKRVFP